MDVALQPYRIGFMFMLVNVSILVLVDVALQLLAAGRYGTLTHVSILVLVDVALQRLSMPLFRCENFSFNPCFSGCCSATVW